MSSVGGKCLKSNCMDPEYLLYANCDEASEIIIEQKQSRQSVNYRSFAIFERTLWDFNKLS